MNHSICVLWQGKIPNKIKNKVPTSLCKADNQPKHAESCALKFWLSKLRIYIGIILVPFCFPKTTSCYDFVMLSILFEKFIHQWEVSGIMFILLLLDAQQGRSHLVRRGFLRRKIVLFIHGQTNFICMYSKCRTPFGYFLCLFSTHFEPPY